MSNWHICAENLGGSPHTTGWANKDGSLAPIIVPATPDGALAKILSDVVENESKSGMKFKIVERGGISVGKMLQKPNPTQFYCLYE